MSSWASNKEDKMLFENWRSYLAEEKVAGVDSEIYPDSLLNILKKSGLLLTSDQMEQLIQFFLNVIKRDNIVLEAIGDPQRDPRTFSPDTTSQLNALIQSFKLEPEVVKKLEKTLNYWAKVNTVKFSRPSQTAPAQPAAQPEEEPAAQPAAQEEEPPAPSTVEIKPLLNKFATFIQRTGVLNEKINDVIQALDLKDTKVFGKSLAQNFNREEIETLKSHFEDTENGALFFKQYFSQDPEFLKRFKQILAGEEEEPANSGQVTDEELEAARQKGLEGLSFQSRGHFKKSPSYDPDRVGVDKAMENFDVFQKDGSEDRFRKQIEDPSELEVYEAWIEGFREYIKRLETFEYKLRGDDELEPDQQRAKRNLRAMWTKQHRDLPPQQFDKDLAEFINFVGPYVSGEIDNLNESNRLARALRKFGKFAQQAGYEGNRMYGALRKLPDTHGAKRIVNSFGRYSKDVNEINFIVQNLFPAIEFSSPKKIQQTLQENKQLDRWKLLAGIK